MTPRRKARRTKAASGRRSRSKLGVTARPSGVLDGSNHGSGSPLR
jgi:hypothetical protein